MKIHKKKRKSILIILICIMMLTGCASHGSGDLFVMEKYSRDDNIKNILQLLEAKYPECDFSYVGVSDKPGNVLTFRDQDNVNLSVQIWLNEAKFVRYEDDYIMVLLEQKGAYEAFYDLMDAYGYPYDDGVVFNLYLGNIDEKESFETAAKFMADVGKIMTVPVKVNKLSGVDAQGNEFSMNSKYQPYMNWIYHFSEENLMAGEISDMTHLEALQGYTYEAARDYLEGIRQYHKERLMVARNMNPNVYKTLESKTTEDIRSSVEENEELFNLYHQYDISIDSVIWALREPENEIGKNNSHKYPDIQSPRIVNVEFTTDFTKEHERYWVIKAEMSDGITNFLRIKKNNVEGSYHCVFMTKDSLNGDIVHDWR